ncbi:hypothetical protein GC194_09785 [bacterium]|nr:hypothetical protein [bacterium]
MHRTVTQHQIIKFVYGELSFSETATLYDEMDNDPESLRDLEVYASLKLDLNKLVLSPSDNLLKNVLSFSADYK